MRAKIYVAGPYSKGNVADNIINAIDAAQQLAALGFNPFVPHLDHLWGLRHQHSYSFWLERNMEFLRCCSGLLRLPGDSPGSDKEVSLAQSINMPVFYTIEAVAQFFDVLEGK